MVIKFSYKSFFLTAIFFCLSLVATSYAQSDSLNDAGHLTHIFDYVARDYPSCIKDGIVVSDIEYNEQSEFIDRAIKISSNLFTGEDKVSFDSKLAQLRKLINDKAEGKEVVNLSNSLKTLILQKFPSTSHPKNWPSLTFGKEVFQQNCAACHGTLGKGDGPLSVTLEPKPLNFYNTERVEKLSPLSVFQTVQFGIEGTQMRAFKELTEDQIWALSFYVLSLRHGEFSTSNSINYNDDSLLGKISVSSDLELSKEIQSENLKQLRTLQVTKKDPNPESREVTLKRALGLLNQSLKAALAKNLEEAKNLAVSAYLDGIEPVEFIIRAKDPELVTSLELEMAHFRKSLIPTTPEDEIKKIAESITALIYRAENLLGDEQSPAWLSFAGVATVLFREGFEALLIIVMLLGILNKANARESNKWVHSGWVSAILVGIGLWFATDFISVSGFNTELIEGLISLLAVVVLLYVGFWLHRQVSSSSRKNSLDASVKAAVAGENKWALFWIAFFAVGREAIETVLFLKTLLIQAGDAGKNFFYYGILFSLALLALITFALTRLSIRLPIKKLFTVSAIIMGCLAVMLSGKSVHAFQELGWLPISEYGFLPKFDLFGIYPYLETSVIQIFVTILVVLVWRSGKSK